MASTRTRQRKLARARYERQLVRRAQRQRRRRQIQAGIGAFVLVALVVVGTVWLLGGFESEPAPTDSAASGDRCQWLPQQAGEHRVDVGTPPANPPEQGIRTVTMDVDAGAAGKGEITFEVQVGYDPCAVASLEYLAGQGFYDGTTCHELTATALRCGDPKGTGFGGPAYSFISGENIPPVPPVDEDSDPPVVYPAGTVAFGDPSGVGGSQFVLFYDDHRSEDPMWSIIGEVTQGMDLLEAIGEAGTLEGSTAPADAVVIRSLTVTDPDAPPPSPSGTPTPSGAPESEES
ncbi:MAG: peptidylprolyl isomerase [Micromonosporaceae bacterium]